MRQDRRKNVRKSQRRVSEKPPQSQAVSSSPSRFSPTATRLVIIAATIVCLLPFIGKPFNIDDPLFIWTGKQIIHHLADPYGFSLVWYTTEMPMSHVTKNPPLASYYAALIGSWTNWSEVALHLAFLIPTLVVVVGTYELARELTGRPLLAAVLTLVAPGFLVSATSVMCDVPMLALWIVCVLVWRKGLSSGRATYLVLGALLIALSALTKYYGVCLIPLLFAYSIFKKRRVGSWALYFLLPIAILFFYQFWSDNLYDEGLFTAAADYANFMRPPAMMGGLIVGLGFTGGCMIPALLFAPRLFRKLGIVMGFALAVPGAILVAWNILGKYSYAPGKTALFAHLTVFIAGGIFTLALAILDFWRNRDADSLLLSAWVIGTFFFVAILNWTVNARSVLPLIPAAAILISRRMDTFESDWPWARWIVALPVVVSLAVSLWVASADQALAYSAREVAQVVHRRMESSSSRIFFSGHWGFQYYMENLGAQPLDVDKQDIQAGDVLVQPENNTNQVSPSPRTVASTEPIEINVNRWASSLSGKIGAGFYSSLFGPLPFAFGRVPPEQYTIYHIATKLGKP
jgi:hypothetical protein